MGNVGETFQKHFRYTNQSYEIAYNLKKLGDPKFCSWMPLLTMAQKASGEGQPSRDVRCDFLALKITVHGGIHGQVTSPQDVYTFALNSEGTPGSDEPPNLVAVAWEVRRGSYDDYETTIMDLTDPSVRESLDSRDIKFFTMPKGEKVLQWKRQLKKKKYKKLSFRQQRDGDYFCNSYLLDWEDGERKQPDPTSWTDMRCKYRSRARGIYVEVVPNPEFIKFKNNKTLYNQVMRTLSDITDLEARKRCIHAAVKAGAFGALAPLVNKILEQDAKKALQNVKDQQDKADEEARLVKNYRRAQQSQQSVEGSGLRRQSSLPPIEEKVEPRWRSEDDEKLSEFKREAERMAIEMKNTQNEPNPRQHWKAHRTELEKKFLQLERVIKKMESRKKRAAKQGRSTSSQQEGSPPKIVREETNPSPEGRRPSYDSKPAQL